MARELSALKIRGNLGEILERVFYKGEEYIIKRGKKPMAALVPIEAFESFKKQKALDLQVFDKIREKGKKYSTEEIEADIREAVEAVRRGG
jgi:prevent-host-death family protein